MKRKITFTLSCKCLLIVLLLAPFSTKLYSQSVTNYTFSATTAAGFTPITSGNATTWTGSTDDGVSALIPLGFDFWYMGTRYSNVGAATNGWLSLGTIATDYAYNNSLSSLGSPRPVIAPLWDDLDIVSTANVTYRTTGAIGSRVFTLQYLNVKWNYLSIGAVCSFQINLYETTGKIEFIYRSDAYSASAASASIGISEAATGTGNYLSVNNAGTSVSSSNEANVTTKRVTGRTYSFTSATPIAPSNLSFSAVTLSSLTLNWNDLSTNEVGYVIYRSLDGINYSFISQIPAGSTSSIQTGLTAATNYYWKVYAVTEGGMSNALVGSQSTTCNGPIISQIPTSNLISYYKFESNALDATGNNPGTFQGGTPTASADRFNNIAKSYVFNGSSNFISTSDVFLNPTSFSVSTWFKTTTNVGGALIGFSSVQTGGGGTRDRFIYMTSTGLLYFGVAPGAVKKYINTTNNYNDGNWHLVTATLGAGGMKLYVDGVLSASDLTVTAAENTTGYWRLGNSDLSTWPNEPSSYYFSGTLDDMVIYHRELSSSEIGVLYNSPDGAGSNSPVCAGAILNLTATTVAGANYLWNGPNGFTSTQQNPTINYAIANAGIYSVQVSLPGCSVVTTAYTNVLSSTVTGQWTGNISSDWSNPANWCSGIVPTANTDVLITSGSSNMPNISTSVNCRNLTVNSGASITLTSSGTLNTSGILTNMGVFSNTGTINFNGSSGQQTFSGLTTFYNITINNNSGVLLPASITIANDLVMNAGILNTNNFNITIAGNWTNNASTSAFNYGTGTVTFNNNATKILGGTFTTSFNNLTVNSSASTLSLGINTNITGNLSVNSGVFDLGSFTVNRATLGGILTVANNATLRIGGTGTYPINYSNSNLVTASTVEYSGTNQIVSNQSYGNLKLSSSLGAVTKTFPNTTLTVIGDLTSSVSNGSSMSFTARADIFVQGNVSLGASTTFNGGNFVQNLGANWTNNGVFNGNTGTVVFAGSGKTVSGSGVQNFNNVTVAAALIIFSAEGLSLTGNLATTGAGSFSQASGGTLTMTGANKNISGTSISLDNLQILGSITTNSSIVLTGNLLVLGSLTTGIGPFVMSGQSKTMSGSGASSFSSLFIPGVITSTANFTISTSLSVSGTLTALSGTATFTNTATLSGTANLFNCTINGTSLQLSSNANLGIAGVLNINAGILDVISSIPNTVNFNSNGPQNINAITYNNLNLSNGNNKTALATLNINNSLLISAGTTFIPGNFTHNIYVDWKNLGNFIAGNSTIQFLGNQNTNIIGTTTFNQLTINKTNNGINSILQNNISLAIINMTTGTLLTDVNTLTITNTRSGNGKILGHIQRTHNFTTGVAYAFESPQNTIYFASVAGVTTINVFINEHPIADFPFAGATHEEYTISIPNGTYNATLRLDYELDELNGNNEDSMTLWNYVGSTWVNMGKTGNSTVDNYVELSGLTNISNRWTMSDDSNVVQWNGSVSTDWNTAANWTVIMGSGSAPPSASDIVNIGTTSFLNQPSISSAVNIKSLNFGSTQAVNLSMSIGGILTTAGISGIWNTNVIHSINANNQTINVNGNLQLSDGVNGHAINLYIDAGTVNVAGSLTQSGNANIVFNASGNLNLASDFNYSNGLFSPGLGTVTYGGGSSQIVGNVTYNNLTINKSGSSALINSLTTINSGLFIVSGELDILATTRVMGKVTINSSGTLHNQNLLYVGGDWSNNGNYNSTNSKIFFNGNGTQMISASTFNNFNLEKPVGSVALLTDNVIITGDVNIISGTLDIKGFDCSRDVPGGSVNVSNLGTIIIGADNAPVNYGSFNLGVASTIIFNGSTTQNLLLPGISFGNLIFRNSGIKILYASISVNGDLTIENGTRLEAGTSGITLNGNWLNAGNFVPGSGYLLFTGNTKMITGNTTFNKVTVTGSYTILNDINFNGLLEITSVGALSGGATINTTLHSDLTNKGILNALGTTTFSGNVLQTLSLINAVSTVAITVNFNGSVSPILNSTSAPQFGYLNINNTSGVNPSVGWNIGYALNIGNGAIFNAGVSTHNLLGTLTNGGTINSSGVINFIPSSAATLDMGTNFSSTGSVVFGGSGKITLLGNPNLLNNVIISNTNTAGINSVSNLNVTRNFIINNGSLFNAGSYNYLIGGNFINNGILNCDTSSFTFNGITSQNIYSNSALYNLIVNNTSGNITISSNVTVNNILTFIKGKIQTINFALIQPSTATVLGASQNTGWVNGQLQKNTGIGTVVKSFEIGNSLNYLPINLQINSISLPGDLIVSTKEGDHPSISNSLLDPNKSVNRYWTIINNGTVFNTSDITFNYLSSDIDVGVNNNAFVLGEYGNDSWSYPLVANLTSTSLTASGITQFSDFQIGQLMISTKTWDGGAGTSNWGDAANWNPNGVPTSNDNIELTGADIIDVNVNALTKNLLLSNPNLLLSIRGSNSLTVSGNLQLVAGTFNMEGAFPIVSGTVDVSLGTVGFTGSAQQTIPAFNYFNLLSSSTGTRILANSGTIGISNTFTPGTNTYVATASTVNYNGIASQVVAAAQYNNLVLGSTGMKIFALGITGIKRDLVTTNPLNIDALSNSSTISYNGNTDQTIADINYFNLDSSNALGIVTVHDLTVANIFSVSLGNVHVGSTNESHKINIYDNIVISNGATFTISTDSDAQHTVNVSGDIINNGILDMTADHNSLGVVNFVRNGNQYITGNGVSDFHHINVNMGTSNNNVLSVNTPGFITPNTGFLTLMNGTFKLDNTNLSINPFAVDISNNQYLIPASAGLWVNAGTVNSSDMNWSVAGLVKTTGGVLNIGSAIDNKLIPMSQAEILIEGGTINIASAISNPGVDWNLQMLGGILSINTFGSTASGIAPFNMDGAAGDFDVSGGVIVIQNTGGTLGQNLGYRNLSTTGGGFSGGTLQMGNTATFGIQTMDINTIKPIYNLLVNNTDLTIPLINNDLIVTNNVTITSGTLDIKNHSITIGGNIISNGKFKVDQGTVELNGTTPQNIAQAAFFGNLIKNLTINNIAGVSLGGPLSLTEILKITDGIFNSAGNLTLLSTADKTALIDGSGAGEVLGNVTMQRYLIAGFGYKYFSSPFQNATVNSFASVVDLNASFPNFYNYIENKPTSGFTTYTNPSNLLNPVEGYAADFGPLPVQKTVSMTGLVNNGMLSTTLYNHNQPYTKGFNLIGNPYASPINWDLTVGWQRTNIDNAIYFFNSGSVSQYTGAYVTYINNVSSDGIAGPIIASMQGFFVRVSDGTYPVAGTLIINNQARINDLSPVFHKSTFNATEDDFIEPRILLRLSANFTDNSKSADPMVVYSASEATLNFDKNFDAVKLLNIDNHLPNLYSIADNQSKLVINGIPSVDNKTVIPLGIKLEQDGEIIFKLRDLENLPAHLQLFLRDRQTATYHDLQKNPVYKVSLKKGTIENRFSLVCKNQNETIEEDNSSFRAYGSGIDFFIKVDLVSQHSGTLVVKNMNGQVISKISINGNGDYKLDHLTPNLVYVVSYITSSHNYNTKIITTQR